MVELFTPEGENLSGKPWRSYPRPQMRRKSYVNLNGSWDFAVTNGEIPKKYNQKILIPFCPESALSGIGQHFPEGSALCCCTSERRINMQKFM